MIVKKYHIYAIGHPTRKSKHIRCLVGYEINGSGMVTLFEKTESKEIPLFVVPKVYLCMEEAIEVPPATTEYRMLAAVLHKNGVKGDYRKDEQRSLAFVIRKVQEHHI